MGGTAQSVTVLSQSQISEFAPFTHYASTAYCDPSTTIDWTCGANCDANPGFQPIASGGNGGTEQFWYVGYDPSLKTVIVAHQGTDTSMLAAVATDANFVLTPLSFEPTLFPGISPLVLVHTGFRLSHARTADEILAAVEKTMEQFSATHVTVVGHSLGAALALLEMVYLPLHLPSGTTFDLYGYGMPRVGNKAFADYVDANIKTVRRVNNKKDIVPVIPLRLMGFQHPSGEKHITESGEWVACSGQENTAAECTLGEVPTIFNGDANDHSGPYDGITMGC
ncbi:alpha/beta-hydrolase [Dendrothele bispora CBS 962.96]|uniref:Alpha/beta-hydrolase n=1 Tax=Dendrothele bispora (strain CBS 962.96) TaxID=1314807 RepID=A0A4S8LJD8_DENBC|nr:alpha/beta-hydrolase [Dendrothele bispora CBS 962.96]